MKGVTVPPHHEEIARTMMREILYDNGCVSATEPEGSKGHYPAKHINAIGRAAGKFFDKHPHLLTDEVIDDICCGDWDGNQDKYDCDEYRELDKALNDYHNTL